MNAVEELVAVTNGSETLLDRLYLFVHVQDILPIVGIGTAEHLIARAFVLGEKSIICRAA